MLTRPLRVALLSTTRAPGLDALLADPARGRDWELVAAVVTDPAHRDAPRLAAAGIPVAVRDLPEFCRSRGVRRDDRAARPAFDASTAVWLADRDPELVIACAYLHVLTAPMLEPWRDRLVNLHDADLTIRTPDGRPRYPGLHATRDAVLAGERTTRSTLHLVTAEVDGGPALLRSWPFPVHSLVTDARRWGALDMLKAYAYAQREWMMRAAWGPLMLAAIRGCLGGEAGRGRPAPDVLATPRTIPPPEPRAASLVSTSARSA